MIQTLHHAHPSQDNDALAQGRHTIDCAIRGLQSVAHSLDSRFADAVTLISTMKGRLIVTGMGKSGHIARKVAATFASTGTAAYFVHPSEASHGDMGMVSEDDVIIMMSNSGETSELSALLAYAKRFDIPIIALARREKSMLIDMATIPIVLPDIAEASLTGAPTTSTTMMLVYCDALAMAVLERRGFSREDFGILHPGGKLGKGLMKVRALMHTGESLPIITADTTMDKVLLTMTQKSFGCAIVVDDAGILLGIVTDGDLRRHMKDGLLAVRAQEIMTKNPITITPEMLLAEVLHILNERNITSLIAVEEGKPAGLIHIHDCLRAGVA
jgi:arabinose-5-phosphate isomerase